MTDEQKARLDVARKAVSDAALALKSAKESLDAIRREIAESKATFAVGDIVDVTGSYRTGRWQITRVVSGGWGDDVEPEYEVRNIKASGELGEKVCTMRPKNDDGPFDYGFVRADTSAPAPKPMRRARLSRW